MNTNKRVCGLKKLAVVGMLGTALPLTMGGCDLGEFTSTTSVTLSGREVVSFLVRSWVLTPIEQVINNGVENFFGEDDGD